MSCIKCKQRPATCDDYCVECEIEQFNADQLRKQRKEEQK